ncbi:MAG: hypothetical protein K2N60_01270 [Oscillospiraceae bacterium]|nr:hypothetical protein [Oscillospiraceae bacterium]
MPIFDFSEFKMQLALSKYFSKVKATPRYINLCLSECDPRYENEVRQCNWFFPREEKLDFSFFKKIYGYEMPNILKAYYSICHVDVNGFHKNNPYSNTIGFGSTLNDNLFCFCDPKSAVDVIDISKYITIGVGGNYWGDYVVMERDTERIFIEYYDDDDVAAEHIKYIFLADSLTKFIMELDPPNFRN